MGYEETLADLVIALRMLKKLLWLIRKSKTATKWIDFHDPTFQSETTRLLNKYPGIWEEQ